MGSSRALKARQKLWHLKRDALNKRDRDLAELARDIVQRWLDGEESTDVMVVLTKYVRAEKTVDEIVQSLLQ